MKVFNGIAEFRNAVGTHLGHSDWHDITQEQVNLFADATGDHQWIHVDPVAAAGGPFGAPIAHGFLVLSLLPVLTAQSWRVDGLTMLVNYGCNKVRFPSAAKVGDRLRVGAELTDATSVPAGTLVTLRVTAEIENCAKPSCVAELVLLLVD
ncbi:MaoC family dehydratase [Mycolicibacterium setense]|jgi:acyl dehydratase